jgi:Flp pilus assembly protein TadG
MTRLRPPSFVHRRPCRAGGLAAVEFVITAPLLLFVLFACAEFGRAFVHYATLDYSIRNAARFVSEHAINGTTGVVSVSATTVTQAKNLAVYGNAGGTGSARLPNYQTGQVSVVNAGGDNIRVSASYPYQPMLGATLSTFGLGSGSIPLAFNLQVAVTMRAIS